MKKRLLILSTLAFASSNLLGYGVTVKNDSKKPVWVYVDKVLNKLTDQSFKNKSTKFDNTSFGYIYIEPKNTETIKTSSGNRAIHWHFEKEAAGEISENHYTTKKAYTNPDEFTIEGDLGGYKMIERIGKIKTGEDSRIAVGESTKKIKTNKEELRKMDVKKAIENIKASASTPERLKKDIEYVKTTIILNEENNKSKDADKAWLELLISGDMEIVTARLEKMLDLYTNNKSNILQKITDREKLAQEYSNIEEFISDIKEDEASDSKNLKKIHELEKNIYGKIKTAIVSKRSSFGTQSTGAPKSEIPSVDDIKKALNDIKKIEDKYVLKKKLDETKNFIEKIVSTAKEKNQGEKTKPVQWTSSTQWQKLEELRIELENKIALKKIKFSDDIDSLKWVLKQNETKQKDLDTKSKEYKNLVTINTEATKKINSLKAAEKKKSKDKDKD